MQVRLPMPTSETIPYVAEVMGATSYEESVEEGGEVKRVQRKLSGPEHKEPDLDREEEFTEYQGNKVEPSTIIQNKQPS